MDKVILVDDKDNQIGTEEKLKAHKEGMLHRAFSIFVFNSKSELMLQKRDKHKYHSGGLWSNTVCSHPRPNEDINVAVHRRLKEEMGFDCKLKEIFEFLYEAELDNNLIEHEFDHVFVGKFDDKPIINRDEAEDWKWINPSKLLTDISINPDNYTFWLRKVLKRVIEENEL